MIAVLKIFLQGTTIALLLHRISYVAQCVCILTKAWLLFTLLLRIAYVELMVGKLEACTWVTYIAKSNNGSMEMTNHTSWSRSFTYEEGGWWKWNTPFMNLSLLYLDNMRIWLYYCISPFFFLDFHVSNFFFFFLGHASWACHLFSFFWIAHASFEGY